MALFDIGEGQLFYEQHGSGVPPLVLVHGLACAHQDWRHQVSHFAPSHRVVSLDQRGHGQSAGYESGFDIGTFAADLAARGAALRQGDDLHRRIGVVDPLAARHLCGTTRVAALDPFLCRWWRRDWIRGLRPDALVDAR